MKIALAILSFRRYEFLKLMLQTLERNAWVDRVDYWLFQDNAKSWVTGNIYGQEEEVGQSLKVFDEAKLPNKFVRLQPCNVGPAIQTCDAFDILFGEGYDFVMLVPNDLAVGKFYVKTVAVLAEQFAQIPEAGLLHTLPVKAKDVTLGELEAFRCEHGNRVACGSPEIDGGRLDQGMWRRAWKAIEKDVAGFKSLILQHDFIDLVAPANSESWEAAERITAKFGTVQADLAIPMLAERAGLKALHTVSPRATHLGGAGAYASYTRKPLNLSDLKWCAKDFWLWDIGDAETYYLAPGMEKCLKK